MIKLIIFDLDGVLYDSKEFHFDSLNKAISKFDNEYLEIDTEQSQTLLDLENSREVRNAQRVRAAMERRNQTIQ